MRIRRFNEEVGFDDEEMKNRLEIPNLKGELEPSSATMRTYSIPSDKVNTSTEIKKIIFRYPILEDFHRNNKRIEGSILTSFYATSKIPVDGSEFYSQLSFAYHDDQYYIATILRDRLENDENKWVKHTFFFKNIEDTFKITDAFLKACEKLGVINKSDLDFYLPIQN